MRSELLAIYCWLALAILFSALPSAAQQNELGWMLAYREPNASGGGVSTIF
jgi:hypothetical protein